MRTAHLALVVALALAPASLFAKDAKPSPAVAAAIADAGRPPADTARDADRKPAEIVTFAGVKPGDSVAELAPGGGYYTRILAKTVGPKGHVYAIVSQAQAARPGGLDALNAIVAANPNVTIVPGVIANLTVPSPVDVVWTSENYHDFHNGPTADIAAFNKAVVAALKPGGVFYVEDHAAPGGGAAVTSTLHRMDPAIAKTEIAAAGLKLESDSKLLANPADPHTAGATDPSIRGKTDRMALKFRKPR